MMVPFRIVLAMAALALCGMSARAQDKSLADIAREVETRRQSAAKPAKLYTNDDLVQRSASADCRSEQKYDSSSGSTYLIERCLGGVTRVHGSNAGTGAKWSQTVHADGSQSGTDNCGYRWTYNAQTQRAVNERGEIREGEAAFRERLESPAPCAARPVAAQAVAVTSKQPFCTDTSRTDTSGNSYLRQRCLDGTLRESGTDLRNGTTRDWYNTIHADGSQSGQNGCGVWWKYDARTDRYETSIGEQGLGRSVFLANLERFKKCDVYALPWLVPQYPW